MDDKKEYDLLLTKHLLKERIREHNNLIKKLQKEIKDVNMQLRNMAKSDQSILFSEQDKFQAE